MVEERIVKIGQKLNRLRKEKGFSIREAARLTGTSPGTIQKVEAHEMVPSIAILMKIARGLQTKVSFLLEEENEPQDIALVRGHEREVVHVPASRLKVENLGSYISNYTLEVTLLTIEEGGNSGKEPLIHEGEEIKFCMEGKIAYTIDDREFVLEPGDCLHFKSDIPHYWKNVGQDVVRVLSVCSPPPFRPVQNR